MSDTSPLLIALELARAEAAGDPYSFRLAPQEYLLRSETGGFQSARFEWDEALINDLQALRRPGVDPELVQRFGETLRRFLLPLGWAETELRVLDAVRQERAVVLTIRSAAAELYALPWELCTMKATGQHLGELPGVLLRYEWPETATLLPASPPEGGPILFAWSAAAGAVPAGEHEAAIAAAFRAGGLHFTPQQDVLSNASCARLATALDEARAQGRPIAVLHILCHGAASGTSYGLALCSDESAQDVTVVDAGRLRQLLAPHAAELRLVVLCACDSGNSGPLGSQLGSIAQNLHRAGIAAVVASRYPLGIMASTWLCESLYRELAVELGSLEKALLSVRNRLAQDAARLDWASIQLYSRAQDGADSRPLVLRPYRGLLSFQASDTRFFYGRDEQVTAARARLLTLTQQHKPRLLFVVGTSGSGKSSLVLAGLVPRLQKDNLGTRAVVLRPGAHAEAALNSALSSAGGSPTEKSPILMVIDQLEELFSQTEDDAERQRFIHRIVALATDPRSFVSIIATLRVDFLGRCAELRVDDTGRRLDALAYDDAHRIFLSQLDSAALISAIVEPARRVGLQFEEGLPQRMIIDLGAEPGALPLLEDTLDLLWQRRRGRLLLQTTYEEAGEVGGALQRRAEELYSALSDPEQRTMRRLLPRLVRIGEDAQQSTRRRMVLETLRPHEATEMARFDRVVSRLVDARLLVIGGESRAQTLEIAHEALIRRWPRLYDWLREDSKLLMDLERLESWVIQWREMGTLLTGLQLRHAQGLRDQLKEDFPDAPRELLQQSEARTERRRKTRKWVIRLAVLSGLAMALLGLIGLNLASTARDAARDARDAARMSVIRVLPDPRARLGVLREVEAEDPTTVSGWLEGATASLREMAYLDWEVDLSTPRSARPADYALGADCTQLVSVDARKSAQVWRRDGRGATIDLSLGDGFTLLLAISANGDRFITSGDNPTAQLWSTKEGVAPRLLSGFNSRIFAAAFSPDGKRVALAAKDEVRIIDLSDGASADVHIEAAKFVSAISFAPDSQRLLTVANDKEASVWSGDGKLLMHFAAPYAILETAFSADGAQVLTVHEQNRVLSWRDAGRSAEHLSNRDTEGGTMERSNQSTGWLVAAPAEGNELGMVRLWRRKHGQLLLLDGRSDVYATARLCSDSRHIATLSRTNRLRVWRLGAQSAEIGLRILAESDVTKALFSPNGRWVGTMHTDGTVRLWRSDGQGTPRVLSEPRADIGSAVFSADSRWLVTVSRNQMAQIHELRDDDASTVITREFAADYRAQPAFSPDGKRVILPQPDGSALIMNSNGSGEPITLPDKQRLRSTAFSATGDRIITVSEDGVVKVWDQDGRRLITTIPHQPVGPTGKAICVPEICQLGDSGRLLTAAPCTRGRIWRSDGQDAPVLLRGSPYGYAVACSADGRRVAVAGEHIMVSSVDEKQEPVLLRSHQSRVSSVALSADGVWVASAAPDEDALLQRTDGSGDPIVLSGPAEGARSVALSPDGKIAVTVGAFGSAWLWQLEHRKAAQPDEIRRRLWRTQQFCPGDDFRTRYLNQTRDAAHFDMRICDAMLKCLEKNAAGEKTYEHCLRQYRRRQDVPWVWRLPVLRWIAQYTTLDAQGG